MHCECSSSSNTPRQFLTKAEKLEMLKDYKSDVEAELKGVEERIKQISSEA